MSQQKEEGKKGRKIRVEPNWRLFELDRPSVHGW
jgi:hypothetical protein